MPRLHGRDRHRRVDRWHRFAWCRNGPAHKTSVPARPSAGSALPFCSTNNRSALFRDSSGVVVLARSETSRAGSRVVTAGLKSPPAKCPGVPPHPAFAAIPAHKAATRTTLRTISRIDLTPFISSRVRSFLHLPIKEYPSYWISQGVQSPMGELTLVALLMGALVFAISVWARSTQRSEASDEVKRWAAQSNLEVLCIKSNNWSPSPFLFRRTSMQYIFWIEVTTADGEHKKGWVRIGGIFGGPSPSNVKVEWDWP